MPRTALARARSSIVPSAVLVAATVLAAACGSSSTTSSSTPRSTTATTALPSTSAPGSSTPGLTSSSLTVGNISILSGPVPGLFQGAPVGAEAYLAYVNSKGGVDGRHLVLRSADDGFSCTQNQSLTQSLSTQVFAFVGSFSLFDGCGASVLQANPGIPDVSFTVDPRAEALPNNYSPQPNHGFATGPLLWYRQHFPRAVKSVGVLVSNVSSAVSNWQTQESAMLALGYHVSYERAYNPLETDFTADILRMRNSGVQMLWLEDADISTIARVLNAAHQQGWQPQLVSGAPAYDARFYKLTNPGAVSNVYASMPYAMFLGQDAKAVPAVSLLDQWVPRVRPGFQIDLFTLYGWISAALFVQALRSAGPDPTRASVLAALGGIHDFDAGGLVPTTDTARKIAPTCYLIVKAQNGTWARFDSPPSGFRCDGSIHYGKAPS